VKGTGPIGFAALLERMPRSFKKRAKAVEKRARQRREAQAKQFELEFVRPAEVKDRDRDVWQDTVAGFNGR
jgi:hypothetical protein